jgi:hypothetical protein
VLLAVWYDVFRIVNTEGTMRAVFCGLLAIGLISSASLAEPLIPAVRSVAGDLCETAPPLARGGTVTVDLCQAWNDYDPGAYGCSPCALPGPEVVYILETQVGEELRLTAESIGSADVRLYLATDCDDPVGSCLAASNGGAVLEHGMAQGGTVFLFVDTTDECAVVTVSFEGAASTAGSTWGALKAIYY